MDAFHVISSVLSRMMYVLWIDLQNKKRTKDPLEFSLSTDQKGPMQPTYFKFISLVNINFSLLYPSRCSPVRNMCIHVRF